LLFLLQIAALDVEHRDNAHVARVHDDDLVFNDEV
jgi:hypothetical protein